MQVFLLWEMSRKSREGSFFPKIVTLTIQVCWSVLKETTKNNSKKKQVVKLWSEEKDPKIQLEMLKIKKIYTLLSLEMAKLKLLKLVLR